MDSVSTVSTGAVITSSQMNSQVNAINRTQSALGLNPQRLISEGRLTLTSGTPVTTSDVASSSTIYFSPFRGNRIALFDGADAWNILPFSEVSVSLSSLTADKNYDLFAYNNSGSVALEIGPAWTDDSTRATALVLQDGVYVKSGATTRRYLGSFRAISATTTTDSAAQRFLFNAQNRVLRKMKVGDGTDSWTYSAATFQQANASSANKVELVVGMPNPEDVAIFEAYAFASNSTGGTTAAAGIGIDSTSSNSADLFGAVLGGADIGSPLRAVYIGAMSVGYHAINWLEASSATGTTTFYGDNGGSLMQTGLMGLIVA
jgi:hypothetical protein